MTNGNGIASIEKTSGNGLLGTTDTYTITLNDGQQIDFDVSHGNGIESVRKTAGTGERGTVDTYTIKLSDGNEISFPVSHGFNSYIHVKYSDFANPTDGQISDNPDSIYLGICTDQNETAPATASSYGWTRVKGISYLPSFELENGYLMVTITEI